MLRISILFLVSLFSLTAIGQPLPCPVVNNSSLVASNDTVICNSGCANLSAQGTTTLTSTTSYSVAASAYNPNAFNLGVVIPITTDDIWSNTVQLPFEFCYFGQKYATCIIGSNGEIGFNTGENGTPNWANTGCNWTCGAGGMPGTNHTGTKNSIMGAFLDLNPSPFVGNGKIYAETYGVAPCRKFVVSFYQMPLFSCTNQLINEQIVLYESTNCAEVFIQDRSICSWNSGLGIVGCSNNAGATANVDFFTAANRNGTQWTNPPSEAWAIIPNAPPVETYTWYDAATMAVVGVGQNVQVCPTVNTTYMVKYVATNSCDSVVLWEPVTVTLGTADTIENFTSTDPTMCGAKNGYITLTNMVPGDTFTVFYDINGVPQPPLSPVIVAADGSITIPNLDTGTYTNIYIQTPEGCESNHVGPLTLVNPPFSVSFDTLVMRGCEVDSVQFIDQSVGVTQYAWDFGDGGTSTLSNPLHVYMDQGVYNVLMVGTNGFCTDQKSLSIDLVHPIDAGFNISEDSICNGETIFFTDNSVTTYDATYFWNFGDGSSANTPNASHQYTTDGVYNASLTITDFLGCVSVESQEVVVGSISIEIGPQDTTVCLADSMMLYSTTTNSPYFSDGIEYAWSPTDNLGTPNAPQTTYYNEVPGDYTYVLTATGYPMQCVAKDTLTIHVQPRPVLLNVTPDQVIKFGTNVQLHAEGVQYYIWTPPATLDNPTISSPIASPTEPTLYTVIGMNEHGGCRDTAEIMIDIDFSMTEFIPSVFSPNGDGKNDMFRIINMKFQKLIEFRVFNRWGKELYSTTDINKGWDGTWNGTPQDPGVYTYLIRVNLPDGGTRAYKGNVTLIR